MPYRFLPFVNQEIYHIYNRGSEKRIIFHDKRDYNRFLKTLKYYQLSGPKPKLSQYFKYQSFKAEKAQHINEILAFCLMPNHFHLLVRQARDGGITEMLSKLSLSYTKYFNTRYHRIGPLFQGEFKAVHVESEEQLIHLSRYIHLNPIASFLIKDLHFYQFSSYLEYTSNSVEEFCETSTILNILGSKEKYKEFVDNQIEYSQTLEIIKHQTIEEI